MAEWNHNKRWNPFNSYKLLAHVEEWKKIQRGGDIPAPILITVDPSNICNLNCRWCNAAYIRKENNQMLSETMLMKIADYLPYWGNCCVPTSMFPKMGRHGVQAVCIAGGGEPLTNPHVGAFIDRLVNNGIEVGVVTNGTLIDRFIEPLSKCTWVGVSIDAGTKETYEKFKGANKFDQVIKNIQALVTYSKDNKTKLGSDLPAHGVSWKYLVYEDSGKEALAAALTAKGIGCKNIHFRPAGTPWDKIGNEDIKFSEFDITVFNGMLEQAMSAFDSPEFGVYGITHKFDDQFQRANHFSKCYAAFMTAVFEPPTTSGSPAFTLGLCCDRRGDKKLELLSNCDDVAMITHLWGSEEHWKIHDSIRVEQCPRCTYQPHNEIYENVILRDSMTHRFI